MPTYEYKCSGCGLVFEENQPITAPARQRCPKCRHKVVRLISGGFGIVFKGSGFYVNDSRGKIKGGNPAPAEATSGSDSSGVTDTKVIDSKSD